MQNRAIVGAVVGLLAGVVFGIMMQMMKAPTPDGGQVPQPVHHEAGNWRT